MPQTPRKRSAARLFRPPLLRIALEKLSNRHHPRAPLKRQPFPAKAAAWAGTCAKSFAAAAAKNPSWGMLVSGAAEAAIAKANGFYRWQVTVRAKTNTAIAGVWKWIRGTLNPPQNVKLSIDIDALNLL